MQTSSDIILYDAINYVQVQLPSDVVGYTTLTIQIGKYRFNNVESGKSIFEIPQHIYNVDSTTYTILIDNKVVSTGKILKS